METIRLTTAQAIVRWLLAQRTRIDGLDVPIVAGVFGIFGHGNVTSLAEALEPVQDRLPTWRGQNEQSMALAAVAYAKAMRRRRMMACTTSIGPGATNLVTAAAVAHVNRLPVLLLPGSRKQAVSRIFPALLDGFRAYGQREAIVQELKARLAAMGTPDQHPFWGSLRTVLLPSDADRLRAELLAAPAELGALRDDEVIAAADRLGMAMVFTGRRHFRH